MDYKLAKELKDAGFPFRLATEKDEHNYIGGLDFDSQGRIFIHPTLSELIEACGSRFGSLAREVNGKGWGAWSEPIPRMSGDGSTPEEAVARLWLALNAPVEKN